MTKDEALKMCLEYIETDAHERKYVRHAIKKALAQPEQEPVAYSYKSRITGAQGFSHHPMPRFIDSESWDIKPLYTQQFTYIATPKQELVGWKIVPIEPTNEMLKAMDECSTEGYDERLLAGHASSVYMAAVNVAPTPPQRTWVGLTEDELFKIWMGAPAETENRFAFVNAVITKLKELNT